MSGMSSGGWVVVRVDDVEGQLGDIRDGGTRCKDDLFEIQEGEVDLGLVVGGGGAIFGCGSYLAGDVEEGDAWFGEGCWGEVGGRCCGGGVHGGDGLGHCEMGGDGISS